MFVGFFLGKRFCRVFLLFVCSFVFFSVIFFDNKVVKFLDEFLIADEFFGDESICSIEGGVEGFVFAV